MKQELFPRRAENAHGFPGFVVVIFALVAVVTVVRSLIHVFLPDGGANAIAGFIVFAGAPDPNAVIYHIFALWGLAQLAMGVVYVIVVLRYRNLIPLMWLFILGEYAMRIVIARLLKPMGPEYFTGVVPGAVGNYVMVPLAVVMILVCLVGPKAKARPETGAEPGH